MDRTALGDRMKDYEKREAMRTLLPLAPVCVRLDGKRFSKFTADLKRPYDERLSSLMVRVTQYLVERTQPCIGYTQSDEISLVYHQTDAKRDIFLRGRIQKLTSILAAMTTAKFNALLPDLLPEKAGTLPLFDCRVWSVPNRTEAVNALLWREIDATKNSVQMAARCYYEHGELHLKRRAELHELLHQKGINWNDYPTFFKRGTYVQRRKVIRAFSHEELSVLPPKHEAHRNPNLQIERSEVQVLELPPLGRILNREQVVFEAADPEVANLD